MLIRFHFTISLILDVVEIMKGDLVKVLIFNVCSLTCCPWSDCLLELAGSPARSLQSLLRPCSPHVGHLLLGH